MTNEEIVKQIQQGINTTANMEYLYTKNLNLIKIIIKPYAYKTSEDDLLQEAYFGLLEAVNRYENAYNAKFMSYAEWWIKQAVRKYAMLCDDLVTVPINVKNLQLKYSRVIDNYLKEYGKKPDKETIAKLLNLTVEEVINIENNIFTETSLDTPLTEDGEITLCDAIEDDLKLEEDTINKIYKQQLKSDLRGIVEENTSDIEFEVLKEIFINNCTLKEVARKHNVSYERIRCIKNRALNKLSRTKARNKLIERFECLDVSMYNTGLKKFVETNTSSVERIAVEKTDYMREYEMKMKK